MSRRRWNTLVGSLFADRIERKWQVCLSSKGISEFGVAFQTEAVPLIIGRRQ
jgi:putative MFS transporter